MLLKRELPIFGAKTMYLLEQWTEPPLFKAGL